MYIKLITQDGCSPCQMVKNFLNECNIEFEEVNITKDKSAIDEHSIMSTPVTILFDEEEEIARVNGFAPKELDVLISQI